MDNRTIMDAEHFDLLLANVKSRIRVDQGGGPGINHLASMLEDVAAKAAVVAIQEYEKMLAEDSKRPL